jgi:hypothetical protein
MMDWTFGGGKSATLTVFIYSLFKKSAWKSVNSASWIWEMFLIVFQ